MSSRACTSFSLIVLLAACGGSDRGDDKASGSSAGGAGTHAGGAGGSSGHGGSSGAGKSNAASGGVAGVATGAGRSGNGGKAASGGRAMTSSGGASAASGGATTGGIANAAGAFASGGQGEQGGASDAGGAGAAGSSADAVTYSTTFDTAESPLSEGGAWHHDGLDWTIVETANGIAYGTQLLDVGRSGPTAYNDSYAYLAGFPADQQASAVIALGTIDSGCTHEVEVLLRWADSAHNARGYECNVAFDGSYAQIVRWNGPVGDYTYLGSGNVPGGVHDGDAVSASIVGDSITLSVNGTVRATATDATYATGNPGVGFWRGDNGCGTLGDYGFTSFTASAVSK